MNLKNKKITVIGLGRSGISVAKFLNNQGSIVTIIDNNKSQKTTYYATSLMKLGIAYRIGKHCLSDFSEAELVVVSPGVNHKIPVLKAASKLGIPIIGEVEFAANFINKKPIIGVTGTNGKTTTVKLIKKMLTNGYKRVYLCGNIGIPLTDSLSKLEYIDIIVAEISSFQLDTIKRFRPTTSVLLNIAEDHMDRYPNFEDYCYSKSRIFSNQRSNDVAIFNASDEGTKKIINSSTLIRRVILKPFSYTPVDSGAQIFNNSIVIFHNKLPVCRFDLTNSKLKGNHNIENIAAASLAALSEGGDVKGIQLAIDTFEESEHRIETIKYFQGIRFVNDSKSTNLHATISALKYFKAPVILIIGGKSKKINFEPLKKYCFKKNLKSVILMGESRNEIKSVITSNNNLNQSTDIITTTTLEGAVKLALEIAKSGDIILLSPACSSFDQFKNYKQRGLKFKEIVNNLVSDI